jgi:hypothetical protein
MEWWNAGQNPLFYFSIIPAFHLGQNRYRLVGVKVVYHTNYGNAQPVKSKGRIDCAPSWPATGLQFNIDNPGRPFNMAVSGWPI